MIFNLFVCMVFMLCLSFFLGLVSHRFRHFAWNITVFSGLTCMVMVLAFLPTGYLTPGHTEPMVPVSQCEFMQNDK